MGDRIMTETDPAKRRALTDTMMAMEGKQTQADPYLVVPGGQHVDAPAAGPTARHRLCSTGRLGRGYSSRGRVNSHSMKKGASM